MRIKPKLSIITINLNNAEGLKKTINSVLSQTFKDYEYIIIDGCSTDDSKELIEQYANELSYWVSEKDNGIYHAMNKGIKVAKGEYIWFLNSGDWICNSLVAEKFVENANDDIVYANWYHNYSDGRILEDVFPDIVTFNFLAFEYSLPHQASLIKKSLFDKVGLYDENLRMVSDWKFYLQAIFIEQCRYVHKKMFVVHYNKEGLSSNPANNALQQKERELVLESHFRNFLYLREKNILKPLQNKSKFLAFIFKHYKAVRRRLHFQNKLKALS